MREKEGERERERERERKKKVWKDFPIAYPTFPIFRFNATEDNLASIVPAVLIRATNLTVKKQRNFFVKKCFFIQFFFIEVFFFLWKFI